jgi:hydroxypyruvate isomerase
VSSDLWPLVKEAGLTIASRNGDLSIEQGLNRREHHAQLEQKIGAAIAQAEKWDIPRVLVFSGNREGLDNQRGAEMAAEGLSRVARVAENAGVTPVLELLNSKIDHQDSQCDHTSWGVEVCRMVASPRVKLLHLWKAISSTPCASITPGLGTIIQRAILVVMSWMGRRN